MFKEKRFVNFDTPHSEQSLSEAAAEGRKEKAEREARKQDPKKVEAAKARLKAQEEKAKEGEAKRLAELETSLGGADMAIQRAETSTKEFDKMFPELKEAIVTERVQAKEKAAEVKERGTLAERRRQDSARMFILYKALEVRTKTKRPLSLKDMSDAITKHFEAGNRAPITEKSLETAAEKFVQAEMERIKNEPDLIQSEEEIAKRAELIRARVEETKQRILAEIKSGKTARYEEEFVESAASEDVDSLLAGLPAAKNTDQSLLEAISEEAPSIKEHPDGTIEVRLGKGGVPDADLIKKLIEGKYFTDLDGQKVVGLYNKKTGERTVAGIDGWDKTSFSTFYGGPDLASGSSSGLYLIKKGEVLVGDSTLNDPVIDRAFVQGDTSLDDMNITPVLSNPDRVAAEENLSDNETLVSKVEFLQSQLLEKYKGYDEAIQTLNTAVESLNGQLAIEKVPEVANKIIEIIAQHKAKIVEVERARSAGYDFVVNEVGMLLKTAKTLESVSREIAESGKIDPSAVERNRFERNNTYEALESIEKGLVALPNVGAQMLTESRNSVSSAQHEIDTLASSLVAKDHEENEQRSSKLTERLAKLEEKKSVLVKPEDFDGQFAEASKTLQEAEKTYSVLLAKPGAGPKTAEIGRIAKEYLAKGLQDSKRVAGLHDEAQKAYSQAIDAGKKFQEAIAGGKSDQVIQELESDFETKRKAADVLGNEMESARLGALSSVGTAKVLYTEAEKAYNEDLQEDLQEAVAEANRKANEAKFEVYSAASKAAKEAEQKLNSLLAEKAQLSGPEATEAKLTELDGKIAAARAEAKLKEQQVLVALNLTVEQQASSDLPHARTFDGSEYEANLSRQIRSVKEAGVRRAKSSSDDIFAELSMDAAVGKVQVNDTDYALQALGEWGVFKDVKKAETRDLLSRYGVTVLRSYFRSGAGALNGADAFTKDFPSLKSAFETYKTEVKAAVAEDLAVNSKAKLDGSAKLDVVIGQLKDFAKTAYKLREASSLGILSEADCNAALVKLNTSRDEKSISLEYNAVLTKVEVIQSLNQLVKDGYVDNGNFASMDLKALQEIETKASAHRNYLTAIADSLPGGIDKYKRISVEEINKVLTAQAAQKGIEQGSVDRKAQALGELKAKTDAATVRAKEFFAKIDEIDLKLSDLSDLTRDDAPLISEKNRLTVEARSATAEALYYKMQALALEKGETFDPKAYLQVLEGKGWVAHGLNIGEPGPALTQAINEKNIADIKKKEATDVLTDAYSIAKTAFEEAKSALDKANDENRLILQEAVFNAAIDFAAAYTKKLAFIQPGVDETSTFEGKLSELGVLSDYEYLPVEAEGDSLAKITDRARSHFKSKLETMKSPVITAGPVVVEQETPDKG